MRKFWVGADPGGTGNFGLAFLDGASGDVSCQRVSSVDEAVVSIEETCGKVKPMGVGIDAPMWWSSEEASRREADKWIRVRYGIGAGTVQSPNSLRGAALVGGMMLAYRLRGEFPGIRITESHPKALLRAGGLADIDSLDFARKFRISVRSVPDNEHERDAAVAAVCAREGFSKRWPKDLAQGRHESEQDPLDYWLAPMHYFWPDDPRRPTGGGADGDLR